MLLSTVLTGSAQLSLEKTYTYSANITEISEGVYKIYEMDDVNNSCRIYNMDFTLWKTISLTVPAGQYLYDIQFVTQNVFNTDSNIELVYTYRSYNSTNYYYTYTTKVINETGTVLAEIAKGYVSDIVKTAENTSKFVVWTCDYSSYPYVLTTAVYGIPGNLASATRRLTANELELNAYPNPTSSEINLPYSIPSGTMDCEMLILNSAGTVVKNIHLNPIETQITLNVSELNAGLYVYMLKNGNEMQAGRKFIVKK